MDVRNKSFAIAGLGESGFKAALLLHKEGAIVRVTDFGYSEDIRKNSDILRQKYIDVEVGKHTEEFLEDSEVLVVSPGVEDSALPVRYAVEHGMPVMSELELGFRFCKAPVIAVTGTNGKSTVVELTGYIFKAAGKKAVVCGNIGNSFCGEIETIKENSVVVLEVSSFQLEHCVDFRPRISVILNVTEDHLGRYAGFEEYFRAKQRIFSNQTSEDIAILNFDDARLKNMENKHGVKNLYFSTREKVDGIYLENGRAVCSIAGKEKRLFDLGNTGLKGEHNAGNILASVLMALISGIDEKVIERAVNSFKGLEHRLESIGFVKGVEFIDDSKGTNIDATRQALKSVPAPVVLIAGGRDKGGDYSSLKEEVKNKVKTMVVIGEAKGKIADSLGGIVDVRPAADLHEAVNIAFSRAKKGDRVMLSPMCSSFDMFRDYKHRGELFRQEVRKLDR